MLKRNKLSVFYGLPVMLTALVVSLDSCAINRYVVAGISSDMQKRYGIYPSVELDIAAITEDEAAQIKNAGVDGYFSPNNSLRKRLGPFTVYFNEESTAPGKLHTRDYRWNNWKKKNPSQLVIIADLPHSPDMPKEDPRMMFIGIKKALFSPSAVYVEVEPDKIIRVYKAPKDPQKASKTAKKADSGKKTEG
jgi:hypothetical protein